MGILIAILLFSLIVLFHELGHFTLAKLNGVTVPEFSLGMGPRLLSFEKGGTRYCLKLLPFGGSCMMLGEDEGDGGEGTFGSKSVLARISIIFAGPFFNFIMAFVFSAIIVASIGYDQAAVLRVTEDYPAAEAGLMEGDVITSIDGHRVHLYREVSNYTMFHQDDMAEGRPITITYERDGERGEVQIVPKDDGTGRYIFGISGSSSYRVKTGPAGVVVYGACEVKYWIETTLQSLRYMFTGHADINDVSGPVGVVSAIDNTYEESQSDGAWYVWLNMLNIGILLSANLGVMNLLPLPALDGGRLVFLLIELVTRRRVPPELEGRVHLAGIMLLMLLMVLIMFNDVRKIFF